MSVRETELGTERLCTKCGEWWPLDGEFYHRSPKGFGGFKSMCRDCEGTGRGTARLDDARVFAMLRNGWRVADIAVALGASESAIYKLQKAYRERAAA